ncbi:hypothetical protein [Streptomyces vinaceus]|uniref:hypothetical protein n=1 Tax=Streptomyces vinaceus TaxID=1960 RepID=UPI00367E2448
MDDWQDDLDLTTVLREGRYEVGPGRYETLICPGTIEGIPVLTFTAPWTLQDVVVLKPSAAYLRYLAACPGAAGNWTANQVLELLA